MSANRPSLLRSYCQSRSDAAFRAVVEAHIDLVYSAARRLAGGDFHLAEDISQTVFADLARKADRIPSDAVLSAWLYRHTFFVASSMIRRERRRRDREQEALAMDTILQTAEPDWDQLAPHLEEAMNALADSDRLAIVLRYFDKLDLREIGARFGISEDAAQKRVARALEKLKTRFAKRGVAISLTALAASLFAHAVTAAPAALAGQVAAAVAGGVAAGTGFLLTLEKLLTMNAIKPIVAALAVAGVATPMILQHQSLAADRDQNAVLTSQVSELDRLKAENERLAKLAVDFNELESLRKEHLELMRLRGESTLRRDEIESLKREVERQRQLLAAKTAVEEKESSEEERQARRQVVVESHFVELPTDSAIWSDFGLGAAPNSNGGGRELLLDSESANRLLKSIEKSKGADIMAAPRVLTRNGQQAQISVTSEKTVVTGRTSTGLATGLVHLGPVLNLLPQLAADGTGMKLTINASYNGLLSSEELGGDAPPVPGPVLDTRKFEADVNLAAGQVLVMVGGSSPNAESPGDGTQGQPRKSMLIVINPTEVDAAGNLIPQGSSPVPDQEVAAPR